MANVRLVGRVATAVALCVMGAAFGGPATVLAHTAPNADGSIQAACPAPTPGTMECLALGRALGGALGAVSPNLQSGYLTPSDLWSAYSLPSLTAGSGQTVAIVDAYDLPSAESDLAVYRSHFDLPACTTASGCFRKVNQSGATSPLPAADAGWGQEIALDIDMVSAICPNCKILLVEATNNQSENLGTAVNTAVSLGAVAVSNSYSGPEWSGESTNDSLYYNHPGVAITASTGDCGYECTGQAGQTEWNSIGYPAASRYVIAVGGTSLVPAPNARGWTETAWGDSHGGGAGSGCSVYEAKPLWQQDTGCTMRTQADVSAIADPVTGVLTYEGGSWWSAGGTSASSPIIAATYALAGTPAPATYPASYLYAKPSHLFDVTGGNNDVTFRTCVLAYLCSGVAGYDGPTGLGTPDGVAAFAAPGVATVPGKPGKPLATRANGSVDLTWSAPDDGGSAITGYTVTETAPAVGAVTCAMTGATSCRVSGLTNGTAYRFTVHANNTLGPGPESDPSDPATPAAVPGAPTGVIATRADRAAAVTWTAPPANGSPIDLYTVTALPGSRTCTAAGGATQCTVTTLTNGQPYTFKVTAHNAVGTGPASVASGPVTPGAVTSTYHPLSPVRVLDTRIGNGLPGALVANLPRTFQVTGRLGIPAGATAVTGNATVTDSTAGWAIYLGPVPVAHPTTSTLNFGAGEVAGNGLTVALSAGGSLSATYTSFGSNTTDLVFDVTGYFTAGATGDTYHPIDPVRDLDTRSGNGLAGKLAANTPRSFAVAGRNGIPADARAVTGNVTAVGSSAGWAVYLGPVQAAFPATSVVNFAPGAVTGNNLTVALSNTGSLWATYMGPAGATTDLVFDVTGYYTADATGASFVPIDPARLLDTRTGTGLTNAFVSNVPRSLNAIRFGGVPSGAIGLTGNLTVVNESAGWAVFIGPNPKPAPTTSTINFVVGDVKGNGLTVALSATGTVSATYMSSAGNTTDLVLDVTGYFVK
jgi:hypothetical protein